MFWWLMLYIQAATFAALGIHFLRQGNWRLGFAQVAVGVVQVVLYGGGLK